jgi:outer membrane protein assembly factor BamB
VIWKKEIENKSKDSAFTPSPLIEGDLLILVLDGMPPGPCLFAFDKNTGKEMWRGLDETANFSSPIVVTAAGKRQLIIWTQNMVNALDPTTGAVLWREKFAGGANYPVSTPVAHGDQLLVNGVMFRLDSEKPGATVLWPDGRPPSRQTVSETSTATMQGEHLFICNLAGELVCIDAKSGNVLWTTNQPTAPKSGASLHITPNGNSALLFNDQGELIRAELTTAGYKEISRARLLKPTFPFGDPKKAWVAPAYSDGYVFARSDEELVCASLLARP